MYLKRKIDEFLISWKKSDDKKPLIVKGARQIGKTKSIEHFAEGYESFVSINFALETKFKTICEDGFDVESIIKNISRISPSEKFAGGKTLILFDEVQDYPEITASLKSFCLDGRFDVICSGSMLGINYKKIQSNSVGYKSEFSMQSLDFEEFLWAKGYGDFTDYGTWDDDGALIFCGEDDQSMLPSDKNSYPEIKLEKASGSMEFSDYISCSLTVSSAVDILFRASADFNNDVYFTNSGKLQLGERVSDVFNFSPFKGLNKL